MLKEERKMFVEYKTHVEIRDVDQNSKITNTALIAYLEEVACKHSNIAGYGLLDIPKTRKKLDFIKLES